MKKTIYMDNAATTKTAPEVVEAMLPYFTQYYGNPSSVYELAGISKKAVNEAREKIADVIGAKANEIYFPPAVQRQITGRLRKRTKLTGTREIILSPPRWNTMRFCIPASGWKNRGQR